MKVAFWVFNFFTFHIVIVVFVGETWRMQSFVASQQGSEEGDESENTRYLRDVSSLLLLHSPHHNAKTFQQGTPHCTSHIAE
jgi:hypothetical protein